MKTVINPKIGLGKGSYGTTNKGFIQCRFKFLSLKSVGSKISLKFYNKIIVTYLLKTGVKITVPVLPIV